MKDLLNEIFQKFSMEGENFLTILDDHTAIESSEQALKDFYDKKTLIQVGLGGSALGPQAIYDAFKYESDKKLLFFNNSDPYLIEKSLATLNPNDCLFHVVSKSGGTAETIGTLSIIFAWLKKKNISESDFNQYFIFCTDPEKGDLRKLANELNIQTTSVPRGVGGRFSVLTSVGLLPAIFMGVNARMLIDSAKKQRDELLSNNKIGELASHITQLSEQGKTQTVFMPYTSRLKTLGEWFVQLWAESLGKELKGLTPIASYGATDQHSQMQLFMQGPKDKFMLFIKVNDHGKLGSMENNLQLKSFSDLSSYSMQQLIICQLEGTKKALEEEEVPFFELVIDRVDETSIGELIVFFEILTAVIGHKLEINPFDQPGVEAGKRYAFEFLKKLQ